MIGARRRLSHEYENQSWIDRQLVTDSLPQDYTVHGAVNNQRLAALLGLASPPTDPAYELFLDPAEKHWASDFAAAQGITRETTLGIHAGSGGTKNLSLRRWPTEHYLELTRRLLAELPHLRIAYFGGPDEAALHARIAREVASDRVCFPATPTVRHATALLGHLGAFLSVDTLFMHLAAAMRVPNQVVIETPTVNPPILPLRKDWTLIPNPGVGGRNLDFYRYDGRPIAGTTEELGRIMASVSVDTVFQELRTRLSREREISRPAG
jgi:hypothetical protein